MELEIKEVNYRSKEYREALELRNKVLRKPLGLNIYDENLDKESNNIHVVAYCNKKAIGNVMLVNLGNGTWQIKQVAVDKEWSGLGVGRNTVNYAEKILKENNCKKIILNSRVSALGFYKTLGYIEDSKIFRELNIEHITMKKDLVN